MEVKNCPFCDSSPIYDDWIAACSNTDCPAYFFEGKIEVWNKRPREEELEKRLDNILLER